MSFGVKMCYLRGIFGASSGRSGAEESRYKGTKKNRDMQTIRCFFTYFTHFTIFILDTVQYYTKMQQIHNLLQKHLDTSNIFTTFATKMSQYMYEYATNTTVNNYGIG